LSTGHTAKGLSGLAFLKRIGSTTITNDNTKNMYGLNSGERTTTFDNTILHTIYSKMAEYLAESTATFSRVCGDDEIKVYPTRDEAEKYYTAVTNLGFRLQKVKQLLSTHEGEFLQLNTCKGGVLYQPIITPVVRAIHPFISSVHGKRISVCNNIFIDHMTRFLRCSNNQWDYQYFIKLFSTWYKVPDATDHNKGWYLLDDTRQLEAINKDYSETTINYVCKQWGPIINSKINSSIQRIKQIMIPEIYMGSKAQCLVQLENLLVPHLAAYATKSRYKFNPEHFNYTRNIPLNKFKNSLTQTGLPITVTSLNEFYEIYKELKPNEKTNVSYVDEVPNPDPTIVHNYGPLLSGQLLAAIRL
jgi:hypothetical protein